MYIPEVNWLLLIGALVVVGIFQTSAKIGNAYGAARCVLLTGVPAHAALLRPVHTTRAPLSA